MGPELKTLSEDVPEHDPPKPKMEKTNIYIYIYIYIHVYVYIYPYIYIYIYIIATLQKFYGAARHKFQKQNAHKNTSVFIEDTILELFAFQCSFDCIFPRKKQKIRQRRRQENHRCGSWGGGGADHIYIYICICICIYIYIYTCIYIYICTVPKAYLAFQRHVEARSFGKNGLSLRFIGLPSYGFEGAGFGTRNPINPNP